MCGGWAGAGRRRDHARRALGRCERRIGQRPGRERINERRTRACHPAMQPLLTAPVPAFLRQHAARERRGPAPPDLLRRVTIRVRLFAAFSLMCVLLGALGAVAWWAASTQNRAFNLFV